MERIQTLDLLRGIALGGILVMNIYSFALPGTAYSNPMAYGAESFVNHWVFIFTHIFFDQKMMGLFSLLFGASALLFMEKARAKHRRPATVYYTRIFWLIVFGICHSTFLWEGDILFYYGMCGLLLFFFQYLPAAVNFLLGFALFAGAIAVGDYGQHWFNTLPLAQQEYMSWAWQPEPRETAYEIGLRMSDYDTLRGYRWDTSELNPFYTTTFTTKVFIVQGVMRAFAMMLIGMALFRWRAFTRPTSTTVGKVLLAFSCITIIIGLYWQYVHEWSMTYSFYHGRWYNHLATPFMVIAYVLLIGHVFNLPIIKYFRGAVANYGRMAFSNYIGQTLICTSLFYGYGLGWFARFDRLQLMGIVALIIVVQIIFSNLWLSLFRYGPLEWVWRLLTFFRIP